MNEEIVIELGDVSEETNGLPVAFETEEEDPQLRRD